MWTSWQAFFLSHLPFIPVTLNSRNSPHPSTDARSNCRKIVCEWRNRHARVSWVVNADITAVSEVCGRQAFDVACPIVMETACIWSSTSFSSFLTINFWSFYFKHFRILHFGISISFLNIDKDIKKLIIWQETSHPYSIYGIKIKIKILIQIVIVII